jgi:hypothetical protein
MIKEEVLFTLRVLGWLTVATIVVLALPSWAAAPAFIALCRLTTTLVGRRDNDRALPVPAAKGGPDLPNS